MKQPKLYLRLLFESRRWEGEKDGAAHIIKFTLKRKQNLRYGNILVATERNEMKIRYKREKKRKKKFMQFLVDARA